MGTAVAVGAVAVSSAKSLTDMTVGAAAYADENPDDGYRRRGIG